MTRDELRRMIADRDVRTLTAELACAKDWRDRQLIALAIRHCFLPKLDRPLHDDFELAP